MIDPNKAQLSVSNKTDMFSEQRKRRNFSDFSVIYIGQSDDTENSISARLCRLTDSIQSFDDVETSIDYIQNAENEKLFLVVYDPSIKEAVAQLHRFPQLISIYIVSLDAQSQQTQFASVAKVRGVFQNIHVLCEKLRQDIRVAETITTPISILSSSAKSPANLNTLDPSFMYSQLLKEILLELDYNNETRQSFIELCRKHYVDNRIQLIIVEEFDRNYENHSPIWWYTKEGFLYQKLNEALRTQDIEVLCMMGFFIRDLHKQLQQLHSANVANVPPVLYRGQRMLSDEFKRFKKNVGNLISFNNFLSTSSNRDVSLSFVPDPFDIQNVVAVLFEIAVDPSVQSTVFASLDGISYFPAEDEILFSMHSIFRIEDIEHMHNRIWTIRLRSTGDDDAQLRSLTDFMRLNISGPNAMHRLASFMIQVQQWDKAEDIFQVLRRNVHPSGKNELGYIEHCLGWICEEKNDLERSLAHYQNSIDIDMTYLPKDHPQFAPTYANLAVLFEKQGKYQLAMEHYRLALDIELKSPGPDQLKIASRFMNMGDLLRQLGQLDQALKSVKTALKIRLDILPPTHPDLAKTYGHLFDICYSMSDYSTALGHAKEGLRIAERSYSANDFHLTVAHNNVAAALDKLKRHTEALKEAEKAIEIGQHTYPLDHSKMRIIRNSLNALRVNQILRGH